VVVIVHYPTKSCLEVRKQKQITRNKTKQIRTKQIRTKQIRTKQITRNKNKTKQKQTIRNANVSIFLIGKEAAIPS
jgi:hypothetical protein